jgi:Tfp pilus assembly PilM family ATPase
MAAVDNHVKATFEVTLDKAGKVKSVTVISYDPHSEAAAEAAQQLTKSIQRCWPPGVKTSPLRLTVDLSKT